MPRLQIKGGKTAVLLIRREAILSEKLIYLAISNKAHQYPHGTSSRIVYIGTTKKGATRVAASAAGKAGDFLKQHGMRELTFYTLTCNARQNVKTWLKMERAFLLAFRSIYGAVPMFNKQGSRIAEKDEFKLFSRDAVEKKIKEFQ
jgi:predicted GIY-YIG superfamily endonuclease